jgi:glycosyltransferase involved in cell wall biosynthesis
MASRIPIIATNVIGSKEVVQDACILVEPTAKAIANGIEKFTRNPNLVQENAERAYKKSLNFRWDKLVFKYKKLYEKQI